MPNIKPYIQKPIYDFYSQGPKGIILKRAVYQITSEPNVWQLIMGDYDKNLNKLDIYNVTNNNDREKILATVGVTLYSFFSKKHYTMVYAKGSTRARTRLYQMGISMILDEYITDFDVYG